MINGSVKQWKLYKTVVWSESGNYKWKIYRKEKKVKHIQIDKWRVNNFV